MQINVRLAQITNSRAIKNRKKMRNTKKNETTKRAKRTDNSVRIYGVSINGTHRSQVLRAVSLQRKNLLHIATVNSEFVMEARSNEKFKKVLEETGLKVADGWGVVWAARILGMPPVERMTGVELVGEILKLASERGEKIFLLGAQPGVAERAASEMGKEYPGAKYAWYEGARTVRVEKSEESSMTIAKINSVEPDYLLVAYGSPWQDIWIEENKEYLRVRVAVGVGGTLDEWAGVARRCPAFIDRLGGKWAWRAVTEPWRWKRILRVLKFAGLVLIHKLID